MRCLTTSWLKPERSITTLPVILAPHRGVSSISTMSMIGWGPRSRGFNEGERYCLRVLLRNESNSSESYQYDYHCGRYQHTRFCSILRELVAASRRQKVLLLDDARFSLIAVTIGVFLLRVHHDHIPSNPSGCAGETPLLGYVITMSHTAKTSSQPIISGPLFSLVVVIHRSRFNAARHGCLIDSVHVYHHCVRKTLCFLDLYHPLLTYKLPHHALHLHSESDCHSGPQEGRAGL